MRRLKQGRVLCIALLLAGCATYHAVPLPTAPKLAPSVAALDRTIPAIDPHHPAITVQPGHPLTIDEVGVLAILNDPGLAAERGKQDLARAEVLAASVLPNPSLNFGVAALISGPGSTPSYAASLTQDIKSLITYHVRVGAARSQFGSVNASLLWEEWQVAQQARLLAAQIQGYDAEIRDRARELKLLSNELADVRQAAAAGSLDLTAEAPLLAARAAAETSLASTRLTRLKAWQQLDALLGLEPSVRFAVQAPHLAAMPAKLGPLLASLPQRRPDLVALRLGYKAQEFRVRAAILAQFPALSLGPSWGSDTSNVVSAGPTVTMDLPIFDRNQSGVAAARATRAVLHAQYQAALDTTEGTVRSLAARLGVLRKDLARARAQAAAAERLSGNAADAYRQGNLDQRSLVDYQTTALERKLQVVTFQTRFNTTRLALGIELALGLPRTRLDTNSRINRT